MRNGPASSAALEALRKISGKTEAVLPFDIKAEGDVFVEQMVTWEQWFTGQGGTIPAGEDIRSLLPQEKPSEEPEGPRAPDDGAPSDGAPDGSGSEKGSE